MSTTGNAGVLFNITEEAVTTATGTVTQLHEVPTAIGELVIDTDDIVYSVSGSVGTTAFDFNLNSVNNQSGTGYTTSVIRNNDGDFTSLKQLVIYNTHATQNIILGSSASSNLFTWHSTSDTIVILPGQSMTFTYGTELTISTNGQFNLKGSNSTTTFKMWILGA